MVNESNPFKDYTNHLAKTLQEKMMIMAIALADL